jgi:CubicO group peptidase (beta-lactamase class C family)
MRLVERDDVELDTPVEQYLHRWRLPEGPRESVTVRALLNHTSGLDFRRQTGLLGYDGDETVPTLVEVLDGTGAAKNTEVVWKAPPGSQHYSSAGYVILQTMIEDVTGREFASYMRDEVLHPLGMSRSWFEWKDASEDVAVGHNAYNRPYGRLHFAGTGAAGLQAPASDIARLLEATSSAGPRAAGAGILEPDTIEAMIAPEDSTWFGLGYLRQAERTSDGPMESVLQNGKNRGFASYAKVLPSTGDGLVVLTNGDRGELLWSELSCEWMMWIARARKCGGAHSRGNQWVKSTVVLSLVSLVFGALFFRQYRTGLRRFRPRRGARSRWSLWRVALPIVVGSLWVVTLYTSITSSLVMGAHDSIGYSYLGPGIHGLTAALLAACVVMAASWYFPSRLGE